MDTIIRGREMEPTRSSDNTDTAIETLGTPKIPSPMEKRSNYMRGGRRILVDVDAQRTQDLIRSGGSPPSAPADSRT